MLTGKNLKVRFSMFRYPIARDTITQADLDALADWLRTGPWLTMGALCREFEERFAAWLGRKYAVFVNSGSSANWLMPLVLKQYRPDVRTIQVPAIGWATTPDATSESVIVDDQLVVRIHEHSQWAWALAFVAFGLAVLFLATGIRLIQDGATPRRRRDTPASSSGSPCLCRWC